MTERQKNRMTLEKILGNTIDAVNFVRAFNGENPIRKFKNLSQSTFATPIDAAIGMKAEDAIREISALNTDDGRAVARCFAFFLNRFDRNEYPKLVFKCIS